MTTTVVTLWIIFTIMGGGISHAKNRGLTQGLIWGGLLGIFGVIVVMFQPALPQSTARPGWYPDPAGTGLQRYWNGRTWSDLPPR